MVSDEFEKSFLDGFLIALFTNQTDNFRRQMNINYTGKRTNSRQIVHAFIIFAPLLHVD